MRRTMTAEREEDLRKRCGTDVQDSLKELDAECAAHQELIDACTALFDAPHQEHFAVRLNDEEMAAVDRIKFILER